MGATQRSNDQGQGQDDGKRGELVKHIQQAKMQASMLMEAGREQEADEVLDQILAMEAAVADMSNTHRSNAPTQRSTNNKSVLSGASQAQQAEAFHAARAQREAMKQR